MDEQKYFIMITKNAKPIFVRIKGDTSFVLSQYEGMSGAELLTSESFRMSVRSHLGKIIITFKGKENVPWIIDPPNIAQNDLPMLVVPGSKMAIWSGNCAFSFCFFPLRYEAKSNFTMPGNYKQHGQLLDYAAGDPPEDANNGGGPVTLWTAQNNASGFSGYVTRHGLGFDPKGPLFTSEANVIANVNTDGGFGSPRFLGRALLKESIADADVNDPNIEARSKIAFGVKTIRTLGNLYRVHQFVIGLRLLSGAHVFKESATTPPLDSGDFTIPNCKTPVLGQITIRANDSERAWAPAPLDVTNYVEEFSDSWSANDYFKIDHNGNMRLLANKGFPGTDRIIDLKDRAFYVIVDVKYTCQPSNNATGINYDGTPLPNILRTNFRKGSVIDYDAAISGKLTLTATFDIDDAPEDGDVINLSGTGTIPNIDGNYEIDRNRVISTNESAGTVTLEFTIDANVSVDNLVLGTVTLFDEIATNLQTFHTRLFTGLCLGGKLVTGEGAERHLDCQLKDFMYVLDNQFMINSPFFDGMRDIYAVRELLRIAMMRSTSVDFSGSDNFMPARILHEATTNIYDQGNSTVWVTLKTDPTRYSVMAPYILPQSYDRLTAAYFKFADGSKISDNIYEMAKKASKIMYFDQYGVFRFENRKFDSRFFEGVPSSVLDPNWYFTTQSDSKGVGRLMYNASTREELVSDVYNEIKVMTSTPNGEAYIGANLSEESLYGAPGSVPGWLGFKKTFLQFDGIFGSRESLQNMIEYYSRFFNPPKVINFECYGVPCRAGDVIRVQFKGDEGFQDYVIYNVSSNIKPRENVWWQQIEAEWLPTFNF